MSSKDEEDCSQNQSVFRRHSVEKFHSLHALPLLQDEVTPKTLASRSTLPKAWNSGGGWGNKRQEALGRVLLHLLHRPPVAGTGGQGGGFCGKCHTKKTPLLTSSLVSELGGGCEEEV